MAGEVLKAWLYMSYAKSDSAAFVLWEQFQ